MILGGPGRFDFLIGDSEGVTEASGSGNDLLDMGADGGIVAIGDHNINAEDGGGANGAGNDRIIGGNNPFEFLYGDSSVPDAGVTFAGDDSINGRGGDDTIFGDNVNFNGDTSVGTAGGNDSLQAGDGADLVRGRTPERPPRWRTRKPRRLRRRDREGPRVRLRDRRRRPLTSEPMETSNV